MNKNDYQKPTMNVVKIQNQTYLLAGSITSLSTNLSDGDDLDISDTDAGSGFWGR